MFLHLGLAGLKPKTQELWYMGIREKERSPYTRVVDMSYILNFLKEMRNQKDFSIYL